MSERKVVPLAEWQLDQMAQIERQCFSDPWSRQALAGELESPLARYFVAVEGQQVLGYLGTRMIDDECQIVNVAVRPDHWRQGIGRQLMLALFRHGRRTGMRQVNLEVRQSNKGAICLYQQFGLAVCGLRLAYYQNPRENALLMNGSFQTKLEAGLEAAIEGEIE